MRPEGGAIPERLYPVEQAHRCGGAAVSPSQAPLLTYVLTRPPRRPVTYCKRTLIPNLKQVGRELGVRYVLEGSVRKAGNRVRITAQLIDALRCTHLWFFRIFLPAAYGGHDLTPMDGIAVFEELAKADASVAWCVWSGNTHWTAAQLSPEAAHAIHDDLDVITANSTRPSGSGANVVGGASERSCPMPVATRRR